MTAMTIHGAPIRLSDARHARLTTLLAPTDGAIVVSSPGHGPESTLRQARVALVADALCRLLSWKGYAVRVELRRTPHDAGRGPSCPPGWPDHSCVHVRGSAGAWQGETGEPEWHVPVGPVVVNTMSKACHAARDWHRERRAPYVSDLAAAGVSIPDLEFGLLLNGHHRHAIHIPCRNLHEGLCFDDTPVARRRHRRHVRGLGEPLPVASFAHAIRLLSTHGGDELAVVDGAISDGLHMSRAFAMLYGGRRRRLSLDDRAVLATVADTLIAPVGRP